MHFEKSALLLKPKSAVRKMCVSIDFAKGKYDSSGKCACTVLVTNHYTTSNNVSSFAFHICKDDAARSRASSSMPHRGQLGVEPRGGNISKSFLKSYDCVTCRSRQELSNGTLVAKVGVDTAENKPSFIS